MVPYTSDLAEIPSLLILIIHNTKGYLWLVILKLYLQERI